MNAVKAIFICIFSVCLWLSCSAFATEQATDEIIDPAHYSLSFLDSGEVNDEDKAKRFDEILKLWQSKQDLYQKYSPEQVKAIALIIDRLKELMTVRSSQQSIPELNNEPTFMQWLSVYRYAQHIRARINTLETATKSIKSIRQLRDSQIAAKLLLANDKSLSLVDRNTAALQVIRLRFENRLDVEKAKSARQQIKSMEEALANVEPWLKTRQKTIRYDAKEHAALQQKLRKLDARIAGLQKIEQELLAKK